jgi:succinyl-diaminopimelate desuccinylase
MKFALAAYMQLVDDLQGNLKDYDFGIVVTSDEEIGGDNGMRKIIREGWSPKVCLLPDSGYNWQLERLAKGLEWYKIEIVGKTAHASRPWEGDSASIRMINLLNEILSHFDKHPTEDVDTISVSILQAGHTPNQLPVSASATLDVRTVSVESHDEKDRVIKALCRKYNAGITKMFRNGMPAITDFNDPYVKKFIEVTEQVIGRPIGTRTSAGGTDARHFTGTATACIVVAPESGFHHAANEWLSLKGFHEFYKVIADYTEAVARPTPEPTKRATKNTKQTSLVSA